MDSQLHIAGQDKVAGSSGDDAHHPITLPLADLLLGPPYRGYAIGAEEADQCAGNPDRHWNPCIR